jgi:hypothetical protein
MRLLSVSSIVLASLLVTSAGCGEEKKGKTGGQAAGMKSMGTNKGMEQDGVTCDAATEGQGFCADDYTIIFCADQSWWELDCSAFGAFCGYDGDTVDCFLE